MARAIQRGTAFEVIPTTMSSMSVEVPFAQRWRTVRRRKWKTRPAAARRTMTAHGGRGMSYRNSSVLPSRRDWAGIGKRGRASTGRRVDHRERDRKEEEG